jgi:hypothetical protein
LHRQLSAGYFLGGTPTPPIRSTEQLKLLAKSSDKYVHDLAIASLKLESDAIAYHTSVGTRAERLEQLGVEACTFVGAADQFEDFGDVVRFVGRKDGVFQQWQRKMVDAENSRIAWLKSALAIRESVEKAMHAAPRGQLFEAKEVGTGFRVAGTLQGPYNTQVLVTLDNQSKRMLHNCVLVTHVKIDEARVKAYEKGDIPAQVLGLGITMALGLHPQLATNAMELQHLRWTGECVERGSVVFIPEWKADERLEVIVGSALSVELAQSAQFSVWTDEGYDEQHALPIDLMAKAIQREYKNKAEQIKRAQIAANLRRQKQWAENRPKPVAFASTDQRRTIQFGVLPK